jgi:exodeoxyribonuclease-1
MTDSTFFWHDYETFGTDPQRDRVCQFAGIRTDYDFNVIGEPVMAYCKLANDYLPHPEACLITGITPQLANAEGLCEAEFCDIVHNELATPNTCSLGYNSLRFDDEVTRNLLYRNFYDAYAREWQNNNSRWDMIDIVRATYALRPEGINWPVNADGVATFRLEELTKANNISHTHAHDALADVYATIAMARLIRDSQPKLFQYLFSLRSKSAVQDLLKVGSFTPLVHISGRFPTIKHCLAIILPICVHPTNRNEVIVYDLSVDPAALLELTATEIQQRLFVANDALPEGVERIPLKTVHINKAPVLAPVSVISPKDAERLHLDMQQCASHLQLIKNAVQLTEKLEEVFASKYREPISDPDLMIYSGGFFSNKDKAAMVKIRATPAGKLAKLTLNVDDARLPEMLFRYRARNYPETLNIEETAKWRQFCHERLHHSEHINSLTIDSYLQKIQLLQQELGEDNVLLKQLQEYAILININN